MRRQGETMIDPFGIPREVLGGTDEFYEAKSDGTSCLGGGNDENAVLPAKPASNVRVELEQEIGTLSTPAMVKVYYGDKLIASVKAVVEDKMGADGGIYPSVTLMRVK